MVSCCDVRFILSFVKIGLLLQDDTVHDGLIVKSFVMKQSA